MVLAAQKVLFTRNKKVVEARNRTRAHVRLPNKAALSLSDTGIVIDAALNLPVGVVATLLYIARCCVQWRQSFHTKNLDTQRGNVVS
jgi:hypothetical protein